MAEPNNNVIVEMKDSYGDGWNGGIMFIDDLDNTNVSREEFTLEAGSSGYQLMYLPDGEYNVYFEDGGFPSEVSFRIGNYDSVTQEKSDWSPEYTIGTNPWHESGTLKLTVPLPDPTQYPVPLTVTTGVTNVTAHGENDGSITVTPNGGVTPYSYSWSHDSTETGNLITDLSAGTYTVTVTDANGNTVTEKIPISQPDPLTVTTDVTNVTTQGASDGSINVTPSGGVAPYTYLWSHDSTEIGNSISELSAGIYTVTVTDANGDIASETITITEPAPPAANICMPAGTLVQTDQGEVAVEKLTSENTIEGNLVLEVTKSLNQSKKFVVIRKGAFGHNLPLRTTRVTPNHSVMYRGRMTKASRLVNGVTVGVQQRPTMDVVYNVVLGNKDDSSAYHGSMSVNGLVVETVKPEHALRLKEM